MGSKNEKNGRPFNHLLFWSYANDLPKVQGLIPDWCVTLGYSFETPIPNQVRLADIVLQDREDLLV